MLNENVKKFLDMLNDEYGLDEKVLVYTEVPEGDVLKFSAMGNDRLHITVAPDLLRHGVEPDIRNYVEAWVHATKNGLCDYRCRFVLVLPKTTEKIKHTEIDGAYEFGSYYGWNELVGQTKVVL